MKDELSYIQAEGLFECFNDFIPPRETSLRSGRLSRKGVGVKASVSDIDSAPTNQLYNLGA